MSDTWCDSIEHKVFIRIASIGARCHEDRVNFSFRNVTFKIFSRWTSQEIGGAGEDVRNLPRIGGTDEEAAQGLLRSLAGPQRSKRLHLFVSKLFLFFFQIFTLSY